MKLNRREVMAMGTALLVCPGAARAAEAAQVRIPAEATAFDPPQIEIKVGDTVEWTNEGVVTHTVTCDPAKARDARSATLPDGARPFNSGDLDAGATFSQAFSVPGTYRYFCIPHESMGMIGTVVVS